MDKRQLIACGRDANVVKQIKGNEEYGYIYIGGKEGPVVRRI